MRLGGKTKGYGNYVHTPVYAKTILRPAFCSLCSQVEQVERNKGADFICIECVEAVTEYVREKQDERSLKQALKYKSPFVTNGAKRAARRFLALPQEKLRKKKGFSAVTKTELKAILEEEKTENK